MKMAKSVKTGKMPWQGKMSTYSGNTKGSAGKFSAKGKSGGKSGCGCGGKK